MNNPPIYLRGPDGKFVPSIKTNKKNCGICRELKPQDDFYPRKNRPMGLSSNCRQCEKKRGAENMRKWRRSDIEKARQYDRDYRRKHPEKSRNMSLKRYHGIDLNEYRRMLEAQNYKCKICEATHAEKPASHRLNVDHCHKSKKIRGLLCGLCNRGLGQMRDDSNLLKAAINYLSQ